MRANGVLCSRLGAAAAAAAGGVVSPTPCIMRAPSDCGGNRNVITGAKSSHNALLHPLQCASPQHIRPPPLRSSFIDRSPAWASFNNNHNVKSFRRRMIASADVSQRPLQFHLSGEAGHNDATPLQQQKQWLATGVAVGYGERLEEVSARWAAKFYGQVTFGPRNYPYPSSRWLARRFRMKKHKVIKRFRFRRYKLAAVANLPFAKMIRVGMLPELKSSKTKKGDIVDADLTGQLVSAVRSSGGKTKGHRGRPKSKYQV
ncbi:hypothetical protein DQ04_08511000 [Trypanosoma grayi]|uniref:hypothetical protein n=1 Tax=Trypanosoma grayi TaxID=71804 RepID=UPI0004F45A79|nr:hypothetical protein DQ04_08511000 [Trypanosoma grayi]KEG07902.1 hypothetical protein DQ04_08511000 [Trypanosoma grayi]